MFPPSFSIGGGVEELFGNSCHVCKLQEIGRDSKQV